MLGTTQSPSGNSVKIEAAMSQTLTLTGTEKRVARLLAMVQFMNIMDFMMFMPLGPDFAPVLGIAPSHLGYIGACYSGAAALAGLVGIAFFDRFDRKTILMIALIGLALAAAAGSLAVDMTTLVTARIIAGLCGGPASAMAAAILADSVANERRGQAMGIYMGAFSMAAVLGVPAGLELARLGGWRLSLLATGLAVFGAAMLVQILLPAQRAHLAAPGWRGATGQRKLFLDLLADRRALLALTLCSVTMISHFMLVPNFSPFFQLNLDFPREQLGLLYMAGGVLSFFGMRAAGWLVDRFGAAPMTMTTTLGVLATIYAAMIDLSRLLPVLVSMPLFMLFASARTVAQTTTVSKVPPSTRRASFMSLVSCVNGTSMALGAFLSSYIMTTGPDGKLENVTIAAGLSLALACLAPPLMLALERAVRRASTLAAITPSSAPRP
jgi:predicted MFS family arabinose efflux permease